jgi:hypothetical protein
LLLAEFVALAQATNGIRKSHANLDHFLVCLAEAEELTHGAELESGLLEPLSLAGVHRHLSFRLGDRASACSYSW